MPETAKPTTNNPYRPPVSKWRPAELIFFILKNVIGWLLILAAGPLGIFFPGPGGLPIFLIGFSLITFPGKRHLTARVIRGTPVDHDSKGYRYIVAAIAIAVPAGIVAYVSNQWIFVQKLDYNGLIYGGAYVVMVAILWVFGLKGYHIIDLGLSFVPKIRRKVRPWMRGKGLDLLPPRRRRRLKHPHASHDDQEIIQIHERHQKRLRDSWQFIKPWVLMSIRLLVIGAVFFWMARPIYQKWPQVRAPILNTNWLHFTVAAVLFAAFLFIFRVLVWRRIISGLGYSLSLPTATRIWSFSELARYLPGGVWQFLGRAYLTRPHGISASVSSASQLLELAIFMLANILTGLICLVAAGVNRIPPGQRHWVILALFLAPTLLFLLHPSVFYGLLNRILKKLDRPLLERRLPKRALGKMLAWNIIGLIWQSFAVWILTYSVLGLPISAWYILAGSYCLAWTVGFSAGFLSPAGMGIREFVFITTLQFLLPLNLVQPEIRNAELLPAFLGFLGILLRLWAIAGELMMAGAAVLIGLGKVRDAEPAGDRMAPVN
jgi:glycosyltransferase 2 family protein